MSDQTSPVSVDTPTKNITDPSNTAITTTTDITLTPTAQAPSTAPSTAGYTFGPKSFSRRGPNPTKALTKPSSRLREILADKKIETIPFENPSMGDESALVERKAVVDKEKEGLEKDVEDEIEAEESGDAGYGFEEEYEQSFEDEYGDDEDYISDEDY